METFTAKTFTIPATIDYQEGGIVSKAIMKNPAGNVTLFAFDKDQALSPHSAPFDAMVQVMEGNAKITIAETEYHLTKGESIVMPANIKHAVYATERFKMLLTMIKG
jgi:quercetin dioxygenase-like cupin family protein